MADDIEKILDKMPDGANVKTYNNDRFCGFDVACSMKGFGFGHLEFGFDKQKNIFFADTECSDIATVQKILVMASKQLAEKLKEIEKDYESSS